ncbi:MAG: ABC transporter permease, partial [Chloroflexi bacterium]|nr:ABC transporter permease [Chloroflexota bacterium]
MSDFLAGWRFALRRLSAGWRFMIVSALGVLVAATLLAITPIYSTAMSDLGLAYRLDRELPEVEDRLAYLGVSGLRFGNAAHGQAIEVIDTVTEARVAWLGDGALSESRSDRFDVSFRDHPSPDAPVAVPPGGASPVRQAWGGYLFHLGGWEDHVELVEGRLPAPGLVAEAVLPAGYQRHAAVGDVLRLAVSSLNDCPNVPRSEDPREAAAEIICQPSLQMRTFVDVTVVGFVQPHDIEADRWALFEGEWEAPDVPIIPRLQGVSPTDPRRGEMVRGIGQMPVLTTREQFHEVFREQMPEATIRHRGGVVADTSRLGLGEGALAADDLSQWQRDVLERLELSGFSRMDLLATLQGFQTSQAFTAVPLLIVLLQVVGIVIYYVVMVMTMLLERQKQEAGVFRSRGATTSQLVGFSFIEGLAFAVPALLIAPWLAAGVVSLLGYTPTFEVVTGGAPLPVNVSPEAYLLAVLGGVLSLVAILIHAYLSVRQGIIDVKREESRPSERNFLQRYFLDFALVGLAALLMWQLDRQGSVFDPGAVGGLASDPLLLAAPFALTASVALMMLRFYPPLIRIAVRLLLLMQGTATAIGLRRAGRAPASYARVTLLIIMAVAVGTFAASYGPTVGQSLEDRARYSAAVDMRGRLLNPGARELPAHIASLAEHEQVAGATAAYRGGVGASDGQGAALLGIDPAAIADAIWWRDDFALEPLAE